MVSAMVYKPWLLTGGMLTKIKGNTVKLGACLTILHPSGCGVFIGNILQPKKQRLQLPVGLGLLQ